MASLLHWIGQQASRVGNIIQHDVVQPYQRDIVAPVQHAVAPVAQAVQHFVSPPPQIQRPVPPPQIQAPRLQMPQMPSLNAPMFHAPIPPNVAPVNVPTFHAPPPSPTTPQNDAVSALSHLLGGVLSPVTNTAGLAAQDVKLAAARLTHNPVALQNATNAGNQNAQNLANIARTWTTRPAVQLATSLVPHQLTVNPTNPVSKFLLGNTPVQNIEKGVASTYTAHPNLNPIARVGLAGAYGVGQLAQNVPVVGVEAKLLAKGASLAKVPEALNAVKALDQAQNQIGAVGKNVGLPSERQVIISSQISDAQKNLKIMQDYIKNNPKKATDIDHSTVDKLNSFITDKSKLVGKNVGGGNVPYKNAQDLLNKADLAGAGKQYRYYDYTLEHQPVASLKPTEKLSPADRPTIDRYTKDIKSGNTVHPLIVDKSGNVLNGHNRLQAYKNAGAENVPVLVAQKANRYDRSRLLNENDIFTPPKPTVAPKLTPPSTQVKPTVTIKKPLNGAFSLPRRPNELNPLAPRPKRTPGSATPNIPNQAGFVKLPGQGAIPTPEVPKTNPSGIPALGAVPLRTPKVSTPKPRLNDNAAVSVPATGTANIAGKVLQKPGALPLSTLKASTPRIPPNDAIVNTRPLNIDITGSPKSTATDIRQAYTGDKNSQIVRGNQIAEVIRKTTPEADRRALTWLNEAGGNAQTLQKWANDKSPTLNPHRADIQRAAELAKAPGDAYGAMRSYYDASGAAGMKLGTIKNVLENYGNRIYKQDNAVKPLTTDAKGGLRLNTRHSKERVYPTLYDAIKGGKQPATTDASNLLSIHNEEMARVNANHKLTDVLKNNGLGEWTNGKSPTGMTNVDGLQHTLPFTDATGNAHIAVKTFAVPDYLANGLKALTEPDYISRVDLLRKTGKYQGFVKTVDLSVSAFHHFTFVMQSLYQTHGGLDLVNPNFWKKLNNQDFNALEQDFTAHTGMTSNIDANMDVFKQLTQKDNRLANLPGVKQVVQGVQANNNFLFGKMQRFLKVTDYGMKISRWVEKHPQATDAQVLTAKRGFAREINAAYGGLNWEALGFNKSTVSLMRKVLLAPDWTYSNIELGRLASTAGGTAGRTARAHILSAVIGAGLLTEGLNKAITGHTSDQNGKGHQFEVEVRPGVYVSFFRGGIGDILKLGSRVQQSGPLSGTAQFTQGKLAPFARTIVGGLSGTDYSGQRFSTSKTSALDATKKMAGFIASSAGPVPFGAANVKALLKQGIADPASLLLTGTGLARPGTQKELGNVKSTGSTGNATPAGAQPLPGQATNPAQADTMSTAQVKQMKAKTYPDGSYSLQQLPNGKYVTQIGNDVATHSNLATARMAIAKDAFANSDQNFKIIGSTVYRKDTSGNVTTEPKVKYDYQLGTATLVMQKATNNLNGYLATAQAQLQNITTQLKDPNVDPLDAITLQNEAQTLQNNIDKYKRYGGFTKPKAAKKAKALKIPKIATIKAMKAPKIPSIRVRSATFKAPKVAKLPVSRIPRMPSARTTGVNIRTNRRRVMA